VLFPAVDLITPNVPEAQLLLGKSITDRATLRQAAHELASGHGLAVLLKAGHLEGEELQDLLIMAPGEEEQRYTNRRLATRNTHGTGCTLSSAVAAFWGRGLELAEAVAEAERYLHKALAAGSHYVLGGGHGPVHHFYGYWQ
jgi:hydroxymethylpyrimidine/phosphomethylpyrimidine kinase